MNRTLLASVLASSVLTGLAIGTAGCTTYGAKAVDVQLSSQPKDAWAYLVPIEDWHEITRGQDPRNRYADPAFRSALEPYRVKSGRTNITATTLPYQMVYVADWGGDQFEYQVIRPGAKPKFKLTNPKQNRSPQ